MWNISVYNYENNFQEHFVQRVYLPGTINQCWFDFGPPSTTLGQNQASIGSAPPPPLPRGKHWVRPCTCQDRQKQKTGRVGFQWEICIEEEPACQCGCY